VLGGYVTLTAGLRFAIPYALRHIAYFTSYKPFRANILFP